MSRLLSFPCLRCWLPGAAVMAWACLAGCDTACWAQRPAPRPVLDTPEAQAKVADLVDVMLLPEASLHVDPRHSKLIRMRRPVSRFSITNPRNLEVVQFSPTEFELIGLAPGETTLTLWFAEDEVLRFLVTVGRDTHGEERRRSVYGDLQDMINEMFPNSMVQLIPLADKLIVRGQARDSEEAAQILSVLSARGGFQFGGVGGMGFGGIISPGPAAEVYPDSEPIGATQLINLMDVPGEQQVMLRVRVADVSRTALRNMGFDININTGDLSFTSLLGTAGAFTAVLNTGDVNLALSAISSNSYSKILAEPNLVTLSGRPASFIAGGEFAVPIVVGVQGAAAATTNFRGFGTQVTFLPTVIDRDRIRLQVAPSVSGLSGASVGGIPSLETRAVTTTVDLREGQWLAIAGLIQDSQVGEKVRVPGLGDIPILDALFSQKSISRDERELIILVSPELVHPLDAEEAPLILPGMEITEPGDWQFFLYGNYEGNPNCHHRSTVYNLQFRRSLAAKHHAQYGPSQAYFISGDHGFTP